jgi:hypothetical protein
MFSDGNKNFIQNKREHNLQKKNLIFFVRKNNFKNSSLKKNIEGKVLIFLFI